MITFLIALGTYLLGLFLGAFLFAGLIVYVLGDGVLTIAHDEQGKIRVRREEKP